MNSENMISFASYVGYLFGGYCGMVGAYVVLRWGVTGVASLWQKRREFDEEVEKDFKIRIGR